MGGTQCGGSGDLARSSYTGNRLRLRHPASRELGCAPSMAETFDDSHAPLRASATFVATDRIRIMECDRPLGGGAPVPAGWRGSGHPREGATRLSRGGARRQAS
jgi:hypothetical protein